MVILQNIYIEFIVYHINIDRYNVYYKLYFLKYFLSSCWSYNTKLLHIFTYKLYNLRVNHCQGLKPLL